MSIKSDINYYYRRAVTLVSAIILSFAAASAQTFLKDSVLTIGTDVKKIESYRYADNHEIKIVDASNADQLREIGEYAFLGCVNMTDIKLPKKLQRIGEGAFRECGLRSVTLPESLIALPKYAFAWCGNLEYVKFPSHLEDMGSHSFIYCESLKDVEIPQAVKHIGSNVFSRCLSLADIVLPKNLKELESYAFSDCISLKRVRLPENSNLLGELIFSGCDSLTVIEELSAIPPKFDCDSYLFEPDDEVAYKRCRLVVKNGCRKVYSRAGGWCLFDNILSETEFYSQSRNSIGRNGF